MRSLLVALLFVFAACGDNNRPKVNPDGAPADARPDAPPDAPPDASSESIASMQIAAVRAAADGVVDLPVTNVTVTYLKPAGASMTNDPAGFTIQAEQAGPAIFVAVDPLTTVPPLVRGDVISFRATEVATVAGQKRVTMIADLMRHSQGANYSALAQNITNATDVVSMIDNYDSELIDVTATIAGNFGFAGSGFSSAQIDTAGITGNMDYLIRVPDTLVDAIDMVPTCTVTLTDTPVGRFNADVQLAAFTESDLALTGCPAPTVVSAVALSAVSVRVTFSRNIAMGSVMADGSQFTFDNGLTATAAVVNGRTVTVTTSAQTIGTTYTVTVANTVTDLQGTALGTPNTAMFSGFSPPATLRINEVNVNIGGGCDLIELRVIGSGALAGLRVQDAGGMDFALPSLNVVTNDIIVIHLDSNDTTNCNINASVNETLVAGQPAAAFPRNYDLAYDFFSTTAGLTATDNVITIVDANDAILDAVLIDGDDGASNVASETAAAAVAAAMQWQINGGGTPAGGFVDADFTAHAVVDSNSGLTAANPPTGANSESLRRIDDTDENEKADWAQGANSWGLINAGQTPLP